MSNEIAENLVERYVNTLESIAKEIPNADSIDKEYELILKLDHIILNDLYTREEEEEILKKMDESYKLAIQKLYVSFETKIEMSIDDLLNNYKNSEEFLFSEKRNVIVPYFNRYTELVKRECENLCATSSDKVLWIGSGPFPVSAILLNELNGCHIDCIDISENAIKNSSHILNNFSKENSITVTQQNGTDVNVKDYSIIIIGVLAAPINPIIENILKNMRPETKILKRVTYGLRNLIYPTTMISVEISNYPINNKDRACGDQVISHIIYNC